MSAGRLRPTATPGQKLRGSVLWDSLRGTHRAPCAAPRATTPPSATTAAEAGQEEQGARAVAETRGTPERPLWAVGWGHTWEAEGVQVPDVGTGASAAHPRTGQKNEGRRKPAFMQHVKNLL